MSVINETLTLTDQFSASFRTFERLAEQSTRNAERLDSSLTDVMNQPSGTTANDISDIGSESQRTAGSVDELGRVINQASQAAALLDRNLSRAIGRSSGAIIGSMRQLTDQARQTNEMIAEIVENQRRHTRETDNTRKKANDLLTVFKRVAAVTGAATLVKSFLGFSDEQTQINARLNLMKDELHSVEDLNNLIYQSALRSRAVYSNTADAIGKMGLNAGSAFDSNEQLIAFMEQVNKQFAIGGASAVGQANAMTQLTQAMAAGALRGEELNSILDAAPGIARTIEQSMGWAAGSIKKHAEEGEVTAQVVKNSLLNMADETNAKFESMPMTMSQAWTQAQNIVQHSIQGMAQEWNNFINTDRGQELLGEMISLFSVLASVGVDVLSAIGHGALWVHDNLDFIIPILLAIGAAFAYMKVQALLASGFSVAGALTSAGAWALAHWPIMLMVAAFAAAMIAAQQFGIGTQQVCSYVGQWLGLLYAIGYNVFASLWNVIASFAEFFANVWSDPLGATARLFFDVFDAILGIVETVAGAIDALLGTSMAGAVSGFRGKMSGWVDSTFGENAIQIKRMANLDVASTAAQWGDYGANLGSKLDNLSLNIGDLAGSFGSLDMGGLGGLGGAGADIGNVGTVGKVKNVEGDIELSDEDVKIYRDLAERRYMNNVELQTLAPQIHVSIPESAAKNLTSQDIADKLKAILIEQKAAGTAVSHG